MKAEYKAAVLALLVSTFLVGSATGVQRTMLSLLLKKEGRGLLIVFLPLVSFGLFKGVMGLGGGGLCDSIGRKKSLLLGLLLYLGGLGAIMEADGITGFVLGNVLIGAGEGLIFLASMTSFADIYGAEEAGFSFGLMESMAYAGYGMGSLLAGVLWERYTYTVPFEFSVAAVAFTLALSILLTRETKGLAEKESKKLGERPLEEAYSYAFARPSLVTTYFTAHVAKIGDSLVWAVFPLLFAAKGFGKSDIGFLQGLVTIFWATSMPLWGRASDKVGRKALIFGGLGLYSISTLLILRAEGLFESAFAASMLGIASGMFYPILPAVAADLAPSLARGRVLGLYRAFRDFGYLTGAVLFGVMLEYTGYVEPFYTVAGLMISSSLLTLVFIRETRPSWPFFDLVVEHASVMRRLLEVNGEVLRAIEKRDFEEAERLAKGVKELEREGDRLRREIMSKIWSSTIPFSSRMDFERLVETVDKVATCVLESHERLFRVDLEKVPSSIIREIVELNNLTLSAAEAFIRNVKMLRHSPRVAAKLADEVDKAETLVDHQRMKIMVELRRMMEAGELDVLTVIDLRDAVDLLEDIADEFEDASDIIRIISVKHAI